MGGAPPCRWPVVEAPYAAGAALSFRALRARPAGDDCLSGVLRAVDDDVLDRGVRSPACAQVRGLLRRSGQELHRPEPGIRAVRRGARLSRHHALAGEKNLAGGLAHCDFHQLRRQYDVRRRVADGAGHDADHVGGVRAASPEMAEYPRHILRHDRICSVGMVDVATFAPDHRKLFEGLSIVRGAKRPDLDWLASGILEEIAALLCCGPDLRSRHRIDTWAF